MPKAQQGENEVPPASAMEAQNLFSVKDKVVIVTGGGSGIGAMIASGFVANGARVIISSRKDTTEYCDMLSESLPGTAYSIQCDVTKPSDVLALVEEVQRREGKLHVLVNNSGTNWSESIDTYPIDAFDKVIKTNVNSVFHLTQQCLPLLEAAATAEHPATVINIASVNGLAAPPMETYAYSTSKAAVEMLSRHMAGFLGPRHITVNSICPGAFPSRMMRATLEAAGDELANGLPRGRVGTPLDMQGTCIYLASRAGAWTTGATLILDGGSLTFGGPKL